MAEVWEAVDTVLSRPVAVKVLHAHLARAPGFAERFRREGIAAARLAHPNVVATYDAGTDDSVSYLVMELVKGRTLREVLDAQGRLGAEQAATLAYQVAVALDHAHGKGLVHRDVKPGNILVADDGRHAKIGDFGIARLTDEADADLTPRSPASTGAVVGTARYLAPEQVEGTAVDGRTDVYALGVVLYEMACGQPPFDAGTDLATAMCHLTQEPEALAERCPDVPPALAAVAHRAMAKDPADRWPTARAMADALVDLADDAVPLVVRDPTPPAGIRPVARRRRRRGTGVAGAVAVVALAGAIAAGLLVRDADPRRRDRAAADGPLAVATVRSFDPLGDQRENDDGAGAAVDGNPATAWATDRYRTRHFGGLKPGVGLVIELETDHPLRELRLLVGATGWAGAVYVADDPPATLDDWGEPAGRVGAGGVDLTVPLGGRRGRAVLLWITDLGDGPGRRRFEVREAAVMGT